MVEMDSPIGKKLQCFFVMGPCWRGSSDHGSPQQLTPTGAGHFRLQLGAPEAGSRWGASSEHQKLIEVCQITVQTGQKVEGTWESNWPSVSLRSQSTQGIVWASREETSVYAIIWSPQIQKCGCKSRQVLTHCLHHGVRRPEVTSGLWSHRPIVGTPEQSLDWPGTVFA